MRDFIGLDYGKLYRTLPPEPDDCPECGGARGHNVPRGCMGGTETVWCKACGGRGKLTKEERQVYDGVDPAKRFKAKLLTLYAEVVTASRRYINGQKNYDRLMDPAVSTVPADYLKQLTTAQHDKEDGYFHLRSLIEKLEGAEEEYASAYKTLEFKSKTGV